MGLDRHLTCKFCVDGLEARRLDPVSQAIGCTRIQAFTVWTLTGGVTLPIISIDSRSHPKTARGAPGRFRIRAGQDRDHQSVIDSE
jgi:hypothetical protein